MNAHKEHIGTIGERIQTLAIVYFVKVWRNEYNFTYLAHMRDDAGHKLTTRYCGRKWIPMRGQRIDITATVKQHETFNGEAFTELERAVVKDLGTAPGWPPCTPEQLPRAEQMRFQQQHKAQADFVGHARGPSHAR